MGELVLTNEMGGKEAIIPVRMVLNDLLPNSLSVFSSKPFVRGQKVTFTMQSPVSIFLRGRVGACYQLERQSSVISSDTRYEHRVIIQLDFHSDGERVEVNQLSRQLRGVTIKAA